MLVVGTWSVVSSQRCRKQWLTKHYRKQKIEQRNPIKKQWWTWMLLWQPFSILYEIKVKTVMANNLYSWNMKWNFDNQVSWYWLIIWNQGNKNDMNDSEHERKEIWISGKNQNLDCDLFKYFIMMFMFC